MREGGSRLAGWRVLACVACATLALGCGAESGDAPRAQDVAAEWREIRVELLGALPSEHELNHRAVLRHDGALLFSHNVRGERIAREDRPLFNTELETVGRVPESERAAIDDLARELVALEPKSYRDEDVADGWYVRVFVVLDTDTVEIVGENEIPEVVQRLIDTLNAALPEPSRVQL